MIQGQHIPFAIRPWSSITLAAACLVGIFAISRVVLMVVHSKNPLAGAVLTVPTILELGLVTLGLATIARGLPHRVGRSLHCTACGYQRVEERDRLLNNCPECGHYWRLFGGWRTGRPAGSRRRVARGVAICFAGIGAFLLRPLAAEWFAAQASTPLLIRHVLFAPPETAEASWNALSKRKLSPPQMRWIAQSILDRRLAGETADAHSQSWLNAHLAGGTLEADLVSRYYDELAAFWIDAPIEMGLGENIEAIIRGRYMGPEGDTPLGTASFAIESLRFEYPPPPADDTRTDFEKQRQTPQTPITPFGRSAFTISPESVTPRAYLARASTPSPFAGTLKVHATIWLLVGPLDGEEVRWTPEGLPTTISTPVRAVRRDLEVLVKINPTATTPQPPP